MAACCSTTAARNLVEHNTAARVRLLSVFRSTIIYIASNYLDPFQTKASCSASVQITPLYDSFSL